MSIIIRNDMSNTITFNFREEEIALLPHRVAEFDEVDFIHLKLENVVVKIKNGVIKIKSAY